VALIGHDAAHLAVFKSARNNYILGSVCWSLTVGIGHWYWSDRHNRHHACTNDLAADPDLQWMQLASVARPRRTRWLVRGLVFSAPVYSALLPIAFRVASWQFAATRLPGWACTC
jgi:fatty acid desaturase